VDCESLLQGTDPDDVFTVLAGLADAVRAGDANAIATAMPALDATFERVTRAIGKVGADLTLVTTQQAQLDARKMASQTRISALEDVNLAEAITAMNQADTAYRAALGAVGTTSRLSLLDYLT
jgi:flagellin-like hook-associated protein FlgL